MLIGLVGYAGTGKSEVGQMVADLINADIEAFADPMKELLHQTFGFCGDQLWGASDQRNTEDRRFGQSTVWDRVTARIENIMTFRWLCQTLPPDSTAEAVSNSWHLLLHWAHKIRDESLEAGYLTPRKALQSLGDWGRAIHKDFWRDCAINMAKASGSKHTVFTDVRFINEAQGIVMEDGVVWRIHRPGFNGKVAGGIEGHVSEKDQQSDAMTQYVTLELRNDGTLEDLKAKVVQALGGPRILS